MLGSTSEAEDAVQDAWLRLSRSDADAIGNLESWLTTVVSRLCLNVLQSRRARPEVTFDPQVLEPLKDSDAQADPEQEALLSDSIGMALLIVMDALTPSERVAFVLHDVFAIPFEEIASILGRSTPAARQLASRARRRVQRAESNQEGDPRRHQRLVDAFLAASRNRDYAALLSYLDPSVTLRADQAALELGAVEIHGAEEVARSFVGRMGGARPALVNGTLGAVWIQNGKPRVVFVFEIGDAGITGVELIADPERLREIKLELEIARQGHA